MSRAYHTRNYDDGLFLAIARKLFVVLPHPPFLWATGGEIGCIERERQALLKFKEDISDEYGVLSSWGVEEEKRDCCKWRGVGCDNITGHVTSLNLHSSALYEHHFTPLTGKLQGLVPDGFRKMSALTKLVLSRNQLEGGIPRFLGEMCSLHTLDLCHNNLTGELSDLTRNLSGRTESSLEILRLWPISLICNIVGKALSFLDLSNNQFTGQLPDCFMNWSTLVVLNLANNNLSGNQFSGAIPVAMGDLNFLSYLNVSYNNLSGQIPSSTQLLSFDASAFIGNPALCGPPVTHKCLEGDSPRSPVMNGVIQDNKETVHEFSAWFYTGMENGFCVFFCGLSGALLLIRSWRHAYFQFLDGSWGLLSLYWQLIRLDKKHRQTCS